jgi:hypothetical protein
MSWSLNLIRCIQLCIAHDYKNSVLYDLFFPDNRKMSQASKVKTNVYFSDKRYWVLPSLRTRSRKCALQNGILPASFLKPRS